MKNYVILILALLVTAAGYAQQAIRGRVTDLQTNRSLAGATITAGSAATITDGNGEFVLTPGDRADTIRVSYTGYESIALKISDKDAFLKIQLAPSSVFLNEVIVTGYENYRTLLQTPGAIALITKSDLGRNNGVSLQPTLNRIPGVQMDQSHSEDARISIRGVGIQSSFGIRNLKIYINDIPLTEANGFTRIEGMDISTLGRAEIIKGPASSIYGAALGGVLLFQTEKAPYDQTSVEQSVLAGSYGLFRTSTTFRSSTDNANIVATYGYQNLDGYREWSSDKRNFISATGQFYPNNKQTISFFLNHSKQQAHIPGALDSLEFATNPKMADSATLSKKAGRNENWTRAGVSHRYRFSDHLSNVTSVNLGFYSLDHPLAFAYIRGTYQSFGGRSHFIFSDRFGFLNTRFIVGAEYLNGLYINKYYDNILGKEGAITQDGQTTAIQYSYFAQAELEFPKDIVLTVGASRGTQHYGLKDFLKKDDIDFSGDKDFHPRISPRIALQKTFHKKYSVYATVSSAFMSPVDYEITLPGGGINKNIQAITGTNYEAGMRGKALNDKLQFDLALYHLALNNELIPQTVAPYQTVYVNSGKTTHNGIELSLSWLAINDKSKVISLLQPFLSYTHNDFTFKDYVRDDVKYSGNQLTGISPNIFNIGVDAASRSGFYLNGSFYYRDQFPITDDNATFNKAYSILGAKLGFKKDTRHFGFDLFAGVNNALNTSYASYIDLNAASYYPGMLPKFYNPSPERNFYGGVSLKYTIK